MLVPAAAAAALCFVGPGVSATKTIGGHTRSRSRGGNRRACRIAACNSGGGGDGGSRVYDVAGKSILSLGSCAIGDGGVPVLVADVLSGGSAEAVEHLTLDGNGISCAGACVLAEQLLPRLPRLAVLSLWNNEIGDTGAQAIAAYLEAASTAPGPRVVNLASNAIGDAGGAALGRALGASGALEVLYMMGQQRKNKAGFGEDAANGFAYGLKQNNADLWFVNLDSCGLDDRGLDTIAQSRKPDMQCVFPLDPHPRVGGRPLKRQ